MSRQIALDAINLKPTPRLAHTDYSIDYHRDYLVSRTGLDRKHPDFRRRWLDFWAMDFNWNSNDGLLGYGRGRQTNMGHAEYAADGSDKTQPAECPFKSEEEVWAFDAVKEYGLPERAEQIAAYEKIIQDARTSMPDQLTTGGFYKTIVSGAIQAFGWDMLLTGLSDARKMERVFDSFFRYTLFHMECWAQTSAEAVIQHDDFVWTSGAFMNPEIYRKVIIPRYAELWKPIRKAGKKLLFCSDGNFMPFAEDIVRAGADGLIFEPMNDFGWMAERFGDSTCLVGSFVDCRDMTFEGWDTVRRSMDRTFEVAEKCKGVVFAVGNHIPANVPDAMMDQYIEYLRSHWGREVKTATCGAAGQA
jgi:uroporphyrinogen-III decarboxylase